MAKSTPHSRNVSSGPYLTSEFVGKVCEESCARMQLVADILLLKENSAAATQDRKRLSVLEPIPGSCRSYGKLRDTIIASTKTLAISIKEFGQQMNLLSLSSIKTYAEKIAKHAIEITEAAACAAYYSALTDISCIPAKPGVIYHYSFERAKQDLHFSYNKFKPDYGCPLSSENVLSISKNFAENLAMLTHNCTEASENEAVNPIDRAQFATCSQSLQSATAAFLTALKTFATSRTEENSKRCLLFGKPLLAVVDSIVVFSSYPQFSGEPAVFTRKGHDSQTNILGGAMAVVSSCIQMLDTAKSILCEDKHDQKKTASHWQKLTNCIKAVNDSTKLLSTAIREHTPSPSRRPSADFC